MYTKEDLKRQLSQAGLDPASTVMVHASVKSVGPLENRGDTLLDALLEYFASGLLLFPTHTWDHVSSSTRQYDPASSVPCVGLLPKLALQRPRVKRSLHPTHSVAAFGERAEEYIRGEEYAGSPAPVSGCWGRLYDENAKILLIGVGQNRNTYLDSVDERLQIPERISEKPVLLSIHMPDGSWKEFPFRTHFNPHTNDVSQFYVKLEDAFRRGGAVRDFQLGDATVQLCDARLCCHIEEEIWKKADFDIAIDDRPIPVEWYPAQCR